jgi:hypothetical protein
MILGEKYPDDVIEKHFSERVLKLGDFKFFIPKFIKFQYGELKENSKVHSSVIKKLSSHGIDYKRFDTLWAIPHTIKDKDKDKDKDFLSSSLKEESVNLDQLQELFNQELGGKVGKIQFCKSLSSVSLQDFITTTSHKEFRSIETWKEIFQKASRSHFLIGLEKGFVVTLNWLLIHDNASKVLNGQYNGLNLPQNHAKAAFKSKSNGVTPTPENPTGNPYTAQRLEQEKSGEAS